MIITDFQKIPPGTTGIIRTISGDPKIRRRLMEMGVIPGSPLTLIRWAPLGDPAECLIRGYRLSLRRSETSMISIEIEET